MLDNVSSNCWTHLWVVGSDTAWPLAVAHVCAHHDRVGNDTIALSGVHWRHTCSDLQGVGNIGLVGRPGTQGGHPAVPALANVLRVHVPAMWAPCTRGARVGSCASSSVGAQCMHATRYPINVALAFWLDTFWRGASVQSLKASPCAMKVRTCSSESRQAQGPAWRQVWPKALC